MYDSMEQLILEGPPFPGGHHFYIAAISSLKVNMLILVYNWSVTQVFMEDYGLSITLF